MKVDAVRHADVDALHREISATRPVRANRTVEVLRKGFNLAIRWGWRAENPASGVHRNHEEKRARYLSRDEIVRLTDALAAHPNRTSANAIRLMVLTGARRGEVLGARWDMFDLEVGIWVKPSSHTKQRLERRVPLSAAALELLRAMRRRTQAAISFRAPGDPPHRRQRTWVAVCRLAGLAEEISPRNKNGNGIISKDGSSRILWRATVRLHDLRHTYASILASEGLSLPIIGALLGHTQPETTARYAHLLDDLLRAATERVGALVTGSAPSTTARPSRPRGRRCRLPRSVDAGT